MLIDSDNSVEITVIEERAEIGFPCNSPGILENSDKWLSKLENWGISDQIIGQTLENGSQSFKRAWLEKDLSLSLVEKGVSILLRTRVVKENGTNLDLRGAGASPTWQGDLVVRVTEHVSGDQRWLGVVSSEETANGWLRDDGTWESWTEISKTTQKSDKSKIQILEINSALEIMENDFSSFETATIDGGLERAFTLFERLSKSLQ
uniref:Uncharacterized protein n=1 Tax=uncultured marine group II/III euryarchaeote KM3_115_D04 TaxID=1457855 RepID=A0A075G8G2_9EURY|nr:hypothetical protein [uncultured marine group II/III euryarchaeote KM3_115_D04]